MRAKFGLPARRIKAPLFILNYPKVRMKKRQKTPKAKIVD